MNASIVMPGTTYKLYGRKRAGSLAVQIVLEEIGAAYELIWVGKTPGEKDALRRISPAAKIPVLVLPDGTVVCESAAILIYLSGAHPAAALAPPAGGSAYGHYLQWMVFLSANVYEAALRYFYPERYSAAGEAAGAQIKERALADWTGHFEIVHAALSPYVLGPTLSAADFYLHMLAGWFPSENRATASRLPKLRLHADLLRQRLSTRKAKADHEEG
jgi:glutathione S-transferase